MQITRRRKSMLVLACGLVLFVCGTVPATEGQSDWETDEHLSVPLDLAAIKGLLCVVETDDALWVGARNGLFRWRRGNPKPDTILAPMEGPFELPFEVRTLSRRKDTVWAGTSRGLYAINTQKGVDPAPQQPIIGASVWAMAETDNILWVGTEQGLHKLDFTGDKTPHPLPERGIAGTVRGLSLDSENRLWIATDRGLFYRESGQLKQLGYENKSLGLRPDSDKDISKAFSFEKSLRLQIDNPQQVVRLNNVLDRQRTAEKVIGLGRLKAAVAANDFLWMGTENEKAPGTDKGGLYRLKGNNTSTIFSEEVNGLLLDNDRLWVVASTKLYRIAGFQRQPWNPTVVLTETPPGGFSKPIFPNETVSLGWKTPGNLGGRTTVEHLRFDVQLQRTDRPSATPIPPLPVTKDKDSDKWRCQIPLTGYDPGTYSYKIVAYDLNDTPGEVQQQPSAPGATLVNQSFSVRSQFGWWAQVLGASVVAVSVLALSGFYTLSAPLRRVVDVRIRGRRYTLQGKNCKQTVQVEERAPCFHVRMLSAGNRVPEHKVTIESEWPAATMDPTLANALVALGTTLREIIQHLRDQQTVPVDLNERVQKELAVCSRVAVELKQPNQVNRVEEALAEFQTRRVGGTSPTELADLLDGSLCAPELFTAWLVHWREGVRGETALILMTANLSRQPWAHLIGGPWSIGGDSLIAGQVITTDQNPVTRRRDAIQFAALGCFHVPGQRQLAGAAYEVAEVERYFKKTWARVIPHRTNMDTVPKTKLKQPTATVEDFKKALREADIVHVATHAAADRIFFLKDGVSPADHDIFHVDDLNGDDIRADKQKGDPIQCRLLVLSVCHAANFKDVEMSLATAFAARGVSVIAALCEVGDDFCAVFFPEVYRFLLPTSRKLGEDLAMAIRLAALQPSVVAKGSHRDRDAKEGTAEGTSQRDAKVGETSQPNNWLDAFVIFGNPTLRIDLA
jgi:hypothetical protein